MKSPKTGDARATMPPDLPPYLTSAGAQVATIMRMKYHWVTIILQYPLTLQIEL